MTDKKKPEKPTTVPLKPRPNTGSQVIRYIDRLGQPQPQDRRDGVRGDTGERKPETGSGTKREKDK